jgi:amidase
MPDELWRWDAARLANAISRRDISCKEAVPATLDRLGAVNGVVNAVTVILADGALAAAEDADLRIRRGERVGPLHGIEPLSTSWRPPIVRQSPI